MAPTGLRRIASEPLLHFAVLGAIVFAVWGSSGAPTETPADVGAEPSAGAKAGAASGSESPTTIVIDRQTQDGIVANLHKRLGRAPSEQERADAIDSYVDGELLYREGLALGLGENDPMVRRRIIQKMEYVSINVEAPPTPDDAQLEQFMNDYPERYMEPPRFDFSLVILTRTAADTDDRRAQEALRSLRGGADIESIKGEHKSGADQTAAQIGQTYGVEIQAAVSELPVGEWGLLPSVKGWTLAHLSAQTPGDLQPLEQVRARVVKDWTQAQRGVARRRALAQLRDKYRVELAP